MSGRCYGDSDRIKHFKADPSEGLRGEHRFVEVRYDHEQAGEGRERWTVDEICTTQVHLETMDIDACWMSICGLHVWLRAVRVRGEKRPRLIVTCYPDSCEPYVVPPGEGVLERRFDPSAEEVR